MGKRQVLKGGGGGEKRRRFADNIVLDNLARLDAFSTCFSFDI
jgi:hypothetical protein